MTPDLTGSKHVVDLDINSRTRVLVYLTKFSPYKNIGKCTLYAPKYGLFSDNLNPEDFIVRGVPYIYVCNDCVEAYAGIFRPEKIFYSFLPCSSFYQNSQCIAISDEAFNLIELLGELMAIDRVSLISFLEFGKVLGEKTLVKNINLLDAGRILRVDDNGVDLRLGFRYGNAITTSRSLEELEEQFVNTAFQAFNEYVNALRKINALVIVPLSAGVDSRFVLSMLHILNYKNVITVTYGLKDVEYPIAKKVAETLGYENIFIEYTWDLLRKYLDQMLNYMVWASQLYVVPNIQEFVSTSEIFIKFCHGDIKKCSSIVFMTGDISDIIAGKASPIKLLKLQSLEEFLNFILSKHSLFKLHDEKRTSCKKLLLNSVKETMLYIANSKTINFTKIYEIFHWKEIPFKFISSSRLPYIFTGFKFITPLWDGRLVRFLSSIPWEFKYKNNFYRNVLRKYLFKPLGIDFEDPMKKPWKMVKAVGPLIKVVSLLIPIEIAEFYEKYLRRSTRNPYGFDVFFPRIFALAYKLSKDVPAHDREIIDIVNSFMKRTPQDVNAFIALTSLSLIARELLLH